MEALAPLATIVYAGELRAPKTPTAKQPHISLFFSPYLVRFMPMMRFLSQRYLSNPSARRLRDTRDT